MKAYFKNPKHSLGVGIDFGTSNSAAAIFDGKKVTMVELSAQQIMPSATYIDKDFLSLTGEDAINMYISANRGRTVELAGELLGEERTGTGDNNGPDNDNETNKVYGHAVHDFGLPGRLFRGTKRLLSSRSNEKIMIFGRPFRLVALITPILLRVCKSIQMHASELGEKSLKHASLGHPVNFESINASGNQIALERLAESYKYAGIMKQNFCPEPIAATLSYLFTNPVEFHGNILTIDFGGGTLDFVVLKSVGDSFEVVATHGISLGGDKIDQMIYAHLIFPLLGKGERWVRTVDGLSVDTLFPFSDYEELLINWPVSYMLNQNKYTGPVIDRMNNTDSSATKFRRLYDVIKQNYSFQIFHAIRELKSDLSFGYEAVLDIPELDINVRITRDQFEQIISPLLDDLKEAIQNTLMKANIANNQIDLVIRTGGSSLIPAVNSILNEHFSGKVIDHDPFTSVAAGLAISDYYGFEFTG